MIKKTQKGSILVAVIAFILFASVVAVSFHTLVNEPGKNQAKEVALDRAMYLAQSGVNWAAAVLRTIPEQERTIDTFKEKLKDYPYSSVKSEQDKVVLTAFKRKNSKVDEFWVASKATVQGNTYSLKKRLWVDFPPTPDAYHVVNQLNNELRLRENTHVKGDLAVKKLWLGGSSSIEGNVAVLEDTTLKVSHIKGNLCVGEDLTMTAGAKIDGNVVVQGNLNISGLNSYIGGDVYVKGDVRVHIDAKIKGNVYATGEVIIVERGKIQGNVYAGKKIKLRTWGAIGQEGKTSVAFSRGGDIEVYMNCHIYGNAYAGNDIYVKRSGARIHGDAYSGGKIDLGLLAKIYGDAYAKGKIIHKKQVKGTPHPNSSQEIPVSFIPPSLGSCKEKLKEIKACSPRLRENIPVAENGDITFSSSSNIGSLPNGPDNPLPPASYGSIDSTTSDACCLYLKTGDYFFKEVNWNLLGKPAMHFYLDLSDRLPAPAYKGINLFFRDKAIFRRGVKIFVRREKGEGYIAFNDLTEDDQIKLARYVYMEAKEKIKFSSLEITGWEWLGTIFSKEIELTATAFRRGKIIGSYNSILDPKKYEDVIEIDFVFSQAEYTKVHPKQWSCKDK